MPFKNKMETISLRGMSLKGWSENIILFVLAAIFSSLMVIINKVNLPGEIHRLETRWDVAIPMILPFVLAYVMYFPFVYLGWAFIFAFWPYQFRPYAWAMMIIGLITGIINAIYQTYAPRAVIESTDIFARMLLWLYSLNRPLTALPSLHVSHSLCTAYFFSKIYPRLTWLWIFIVALISVSTLFVKHHYIADVTVGAILGVIVSLGIGILWEKKIEFAWLG
jgi:membrane-associated phospholipid phosphatase